MVQKVRSKVPFTLDTVGVCQCPGCPVQSQSTCVSSLKSRLTDAVKNDPLKHEEISGAYCEAGKATCTYLNPKQTCQCGLCQVFHDYTLVKGVPSGYFCRDGVAG